MIKDALAYFTDVDDGQVLSPPNSTSVDIPSEKTIDLEKNTQFVNPTMKVFVAIPEVTGDVTTTGSETQIKAFLQFSDTSTFTTIKRSVEIIPTSTIEEARTRDNYCTLPGGKLPQFVRVLFTITRAAAGGTTKIKVRSLFTHEVSDNTQYWY